MSTPTTDPDQGQVAYDEPDAEAYDDLPDALPEQEPETWEPMAIPEDVEADGDQ